MQNLSLFVQSVSMLASGNLWVFAGIAAVACILGIEVAGIWILIRKFLQAKRRLEAAEAEDSEQNYSHYAAVAFGMAALPLTAETVLLVLSVLAAVGALLFLILLVAFRLCGYDYASAEFLRAQQSKTDSDQAYEPVALPEESAPANPEPAVIAERMDEATAVFSEAVEELDECEPAETEPVNAVDAECEEAEREDAEVATGEVLEAQSSEAASTDAEPSGESVNMAPVGVPANGANGPTRIVQIEKQYTETVKEVQAPAAAPAIDPATGLLIEKLNTLIDKMDQKQQQEAEKAAHPAQDGADKLSANAELSEDEEDDEDEDDADAEDADGVAEGKGDDDSDDEPDDPEHFTGNERIIGFDEETGCYIVAHYRKSFEAKLIQSRPNIKNYYSEIKNALLAYKGTKSRISWTADSFHNGRSAIAKINVKTRILELYLALDPASLEGTVYRGHDVGRMKKYADTPFRYKIRTPRKFRWALELVQRVCEEHGLSPIDIERVDYELQYPFEDTDSLVARGLIKEYIREENPASTFELDESHVTALPSEDETVIPANANFSWEFDNEMLAQKEPEPIPEPTPEPEVEPIPEPAPEPATEPTSVGSVIRETTKVTKVRYTEQYYGDPNSPTVYKEYLTSEDPFTADIPSFGSAPAPQEATAPEQETADEEVTEITETDAEETADFEETVAEEIDEAAEEDLSEEEELIEEDLADEPEEESGLLSAFEQDGRTMEAEDDLDWGIPAGLTVQTDVGQDETEGSEGELTEEEAFPEESGEEYSKEIASDENGEEYAEEGYAYDENGEEYAEEGYAYDENGEEYAEEGYAYDENGEEYAEEGYAYDENGEEYAEEGYSYDENGEEYAEAYSEEPPILPQVNPEIALIDVSVLEENFPNGAEIDLAALKEMGLVLPTAKTLKVTATGELSKAFTVVADQFSMNAIIAIDAAGGDAQKIIKR